MATTVYHHGLAGLFAHFIFTGSTFLALAAAWYTGAFLSKKKFNGWIVGIDALIAFCIIGQFILILGLEIDGVDNYLRILINNECYVDWDGRSNPTVCD